MVSAIYLEDEIILSKGTSTSRSNGKWEGRDRIGTSTV